MNETKQKTLLRQSTKGNQINVHIDSTCDPSSEFASKCNDMSPKNLSLEEKKYLLAVRDGDLANVKKMIHKAYRFATIDVNCVDSLGRGALNLAIESENVEMVELLIVMGVEPKDALLHAINAEFVEAVELLLEYEEIVYEEGEKYSWEKVNWNTAVFTPDITPLILAAHKDNFEILKILLDRGATLPMPHHVGCGCSACTQESSVDSLRHSMSRVNEYRALASPSLMCLSSDDPVLTAFKLSWELRNLAREEKECQKEYTELRRQCQQFAVDLLDQTRSSEELAVILDHEQQTKCDVDIAETDAVQLPLLHLAIKYKQKKFIAHPHVQQLLSKIWYDGLPGFRSKSLLSKTWNVLFVAFLYPVYCVSYILFPNSELGRSIKKPIVKFLIHVTSYLFFLGILILVSQRAEVRLIELLGTERMKANLQKELQKQRGNGPTFLEWHVLVYVLGYMRTEYVEIERVGLEKHARNSMWNVVELVKNVIYGLVIALRAYAYLSERAEIERDPSAAFVPREQWHPFDPQLVAESLFATANVLSALKLIYMFSVNSHLGPLQLSLGRMFIDIVKFFSIYALVLFSFACGLNQLLWYYTLLERKKCYTLPGDAPDWDHASESCTKWRSFGNLFESIQTLFWTGFGEIGIESFDLDGINAYTRFWGLLMFAAYLVLNVTVLLNLLIAMMSNSYSVIQEQADTEWKFARTKLWIDCFEKMSTLPSPYNLLPNRKGFDRLANWLGSRCVGDKAPPRRERELERERERDSSFSRGNVRKEGQASFAQVIRALVWRYVSLRHMQSEMNAVTEDHIQEIKSDISALKFQLFDVLKQNGMQIPSQHKRDKVLSKKMRVWERQLMKDFHVGIVVKRDQADSYSEDETPTNGSGGRAEAETETEAEAEADAEAEAAEKRDKNRRFRSIAKRAAMQSPTKKWRKTIDQVYKFSQIGKCQTEESLKKQRELQKAIDEMKSMREETPTSPVKILCPLQRPSLLDLMKNVRRDDNPRS